MEEKPRLLDVGTIQAVYVDGICQVEIVGSNVRITLCETRRINGERVRVPVIEIVRPMVCDMTEQYLRLLQECRARQVEVSTVLQ